MSKYKTSRGASITKLVIWSIVALILIPTFLLLMLGKTFSINISGVTFFDNYFYSESQSYSVGNTSYKGSIDEISIDWVAGEVNIILYAGDNIKVEESGAGENDPDRMRTRIEDNTLEIKFVKSGVKVSSNTLSKKLFVYLPEDASGWELDIDIDTVSAGVNVGKEGEIIKVGDVEIDTASGKTQIFADAADVSVDSASGNIGITGNIHRAEIGSVSGAVNITGEVSDVHISTVSGDVKLTTYIALPKKMQVDTVSGDVEIILPDIMDGFDADLDSVSGKMSWNDGSGRSFTYGQGRADYDFETVSGDVKIQISNKEE